MGETAGDDQPNGFIYFQGVAEDSAERGRAWSEVDSHILDGSSKADHILSLRVRSALEVESTKRLRGRCAHISLRYFAKYLTQLLVKVWLKENAPVVLKLEEVDNIKVWESSGFQLEHSGKGGLPNFPGCLPRVPESFEVDFIAKRIHGLPKAVVEVSIELSV